MDASLEEVVYMYKPTREGEFLREMLSDFKGVLVSDFYAAYDSIDCPQQKCLLHIIRDMNGAGRMGVHIGNPGVRGVGLNLRSSKSAKFELSLVFSDCHKRPDGTCESA